MGQNMVNNNTYILIHKNLMNILNVFCICFQELCFVKHLQFTLEIICSVFYIYTQMCEIKNETMDLKWNNELYKSYIGCIAPKSTLMQLWDFEEGPKMGKMWSKVMNTKSLMLKNMSWKWKQMSQFIFSGDCD